MLARYCIEDHLKVRCVCLNEFMRHAGGVINETEVQIIAGNNCKCERIIGVLGFHNRYKARMLAEVQSIFVT